MPIRSDGMPVRALPPLPQGYRVQSWGRRVEELAVVCCAGCIRQRFRRIKRSAGLWIEVEEERPGGWVRVDARIGQRDDHHVQVAQTRADELFLLRAMGVAPDKTLHECIQVREAEALRNWVLASCG